MRPQFETLFERHSYNIRPGSIFNVGSGWQDQLRQASAALAGCEDRVWIKGGWKEEGALVLDVDFEGEPSEQTAADVRKLLKIVRDKSLTVCEACGRPGSLRRNGAVRCDEHANLISLEEAAKLLEVDKLHLMHIVDVGDVVPALVILHDGTVWHEEAEFGFTSGDIVRFQEERDARRFKHVHEQFGYTVPADARFACGSGWEFVIRRLADRLGALHGPKLVGGKEKFGSFIACIGGEYPDELRETVSKLKEEARKLSLTICEECGGAGTAADGHQHRKNNV